MRKHPTRRIPYAGPEHQSREIHARHVHHADGWSYYGNGETVLVVCKKPRRGKPICEVVGENGLNIWGEDFNYADYFLPEELVVQRRKADKTDVDRMCFWNDNLATTSRDAGYGPVPLCAPCAKTWPHSPSSTGV